MDSLQTFELNLKMNKKEKSIAFKVEKQESFDKDNSNDDESLNLLTKIFNKFSEKNEQEKSSQSSRRFNNFQKNKKLMSIVENKKQGKMIQCKECEVFGHSQFECANTLNKKEKSLKTTQSDDEYDDSEEDDDNIRNYAGFQVTIKKLIDIVTIDVAMTKMIATSSDDIAIYENLDPEICEDSESNKSDEKKSSTEHI